ncbi:methyl-accepting chemotaxis protein [Desulfocurvus sp. DL9XJH121]
MLRRFSVSLRVTSLLILSTVFTLLVCGAFSFYMNTIKAESLSEAKNAMRAGYERTLKFSIQTMATELKEVCERARQDGTNVEDAIRAAVEPAKYEDGGYYFVYDTKGRTVSLPVAKKLEGTNRLDIKDKKGNLMVREMIAKAKDGGGFITYWYPKPGEEEPSPKLAYAAMIEGTDFWIGTGIYIDSINSERERIETRLEGITRTALITIGVTIGVVFLLLILPLSIAIIRSITKPLNAVTEHAAHVAEGDLSVKVRAQGKDEITRLETALATMISTLRTNIEQIEVDKAAATEKAREAEIAAEDARKARETAERAKSEGMQAAAAQLEAVVAGVTAASEEIAAQADEIRRGAGQQAAQISETATAMEEMNATVLEVARNSGEAAEVSTQARDKAQKGANIVNQSILAMQSTQEQSLKLKDNMSHLGEQTEAIGNIMNVISDIADQTNLLALNAAIEAARAGEAGRGFAVVADEVRKLAEKTMQATSEVGQSIQAIQSGARQSIHSVEQAVEEMDKVVTLANESGQVLGEIVTGVESSAEQIQSIATAAEQQSATSEQINRSIEEINRITDDTTQGVQQTTDAIQELTSQLAKLGELVNELKNS